jgi:hypothetical protein
MLNVGIWLPLLGALGIVLWPGELDGKRWQQVALTVRSLLWFGVW